MGRGQSMGKHHTVRRSESANVPLHCSDYRSLYSFQISRVLNVLNTQIENTKGMVSSVL